MILLTLLAAVLSLAVLSYLAGRWSGRSDDVTQCLAIDDAARVLDEAGDLDGQPLRNAAARALQLLRGQS